MRRQTIFISSVNRGMEDLRSGLKYELERRGLEVRLSEEANFPIPGASSALNECLAVAKASDVYLLIIGEERGSIIEDSSPTREEFRAAREEARLTGKPQLIFSIRAATRGGVTALQAQADLPPDKQFLVDFVQEVEMAPQKGDHNYLHRFSSFESLVTIVATRLSLGRNFDETVARHTVLQEALANLMRICSRTGRSAIPNHWWVRVARDELTLTSNDMAKNILVSQRVANSLVGSVAVHELANLEVDGMESALRAGHFLDFNPVTQEFTPDELRRAVTKLLGDIRVAKQTGRGDQNWIQILLVAGARANRQKSSVEVPAEAALWAQAYFDRAENVFNGLVALAGHLLDPTRRPTPPERRPRSPVPDFDRGLWQEELGMEDIERLVRNQISPFGDRLAPSSKQSLADLKAKLLAKTRDRLREMYPGAKLDDLFSLEDMAGVIQPLMATDEEAIDDRGR